MFAQLYEVGAVWNLQLARPKTEEQKLDIKLELLVSFCAPIGTYFTTFSYVFISCGYHCNILVVLCWI